MRKFIICLIVLILNFNIAYASDYENHWAKSYIDYAISNGFAFGTQDGNFEPDRPITRAEFINILARYVKLGSNVFFTSFNDISPDSWYFPMIVSAEDAGIIKGYDDGGFHPDSPVTREDAITFICRAYKTDPPYYDIFALFSDISDTSDYAKKYVIFAAENKILIGYENNTIKPKNYITRAEALVMLNNFSSISDSFEKTPEFAEGYPKISPKGSVNNITVELKTNIPCTIYYKAVKKNTSESYLTPKKEDINTILAHISSPDTAVVSNIVLGSYNENYNLFFLPVADHGTTGKISRIKDIKALAYSDGDGSPENPYIIYDENQLDYIRYCQDKHFKLANDITLTKDWTPINASDGYFGSLNGGGHTIFNLNIKSNSDNAGLFSVISNGIIQNLTISGDVYAKNNAGLFAGTSDGTIISNCAAAGFVKVSANNAGGITGTNNGIIENCLSALYSVEATANAGGISGSGNGKITNSLSAVHSVLSDMYAGGVSGINNGGTIKNCIAANMNVVDYLTYSSGRITTNKENGVTENNYGYSEMNTNSAMLIRDADNINGADISWNSLFTKDFYEKNLFWDFTNEWNFSDNIKNTFVFPFPKAFADIALKPGITPYAPIKISLAEDIAKINPELHYMLVNDIDCTNVTMLLPHNQDFNGSLDGNGFSILNLKIKNDGKCSLFGTISDGSVRNLNLVNFTADGKNSVSAIAQTNYGIIENCSVSGNISASTVTSSVSCGAISVINYGTVENCDSKVNFNITGNSSTTGGIVSHNEGFINNSSYIGNIAVNPTGKKSSSASGGIAGFNNDGFIYNSSSKINLDVSSYTSYTGGICGIFNSGEIFKTSSSGKIKASSSKINSTAYTGGICGLSETGLIFNSFSSAGINTDSQSGYAGGITGYNSSANIQCTYAINTISQSGRNDSDSESKIYSGGIAGYNESGFLSDNAAINPWIVSNGIVKRISFSPDDGYLSNNYAHKKMLSTDDANDEQNGISTDLNNLKDISFFLTPVYDGGKLGWSSTTYDGDAGVWKAPNVYNNIYCFPILNGVKNQSDFTIPPELR